MTLADRFSTIEELLESDDNELNKLGITNQADRICLMKQARLLDNTTNQPLILKRRSAIANRVIENWIGDNQATRLNSNVLSKSTCNLSPAMLSRISFNDRPASVVYPYAEPTSDIRKRNFGHVMESEEKIITVDDNGKIQTKIASLSSPLDYQGVLKQTSSTSFHGMRTIKSLSDTISLQKKVLGTDRLKRLDSSTSLFQRQTSFISKKVTNLANKLVNPFVIIKKKIEPSSSSSTTVDSQIDLRTNMKRQVSLVENKNDITITAKRTVTISPLKRTRDDDDDEPKEHRKVQVLSTNNEIRRSTGLFSYEEEEEEAKRHEKKILKIFRISVNYSNPTPAPFKAEWDTQFKGLYGSIPLRCYSSDGRYLLLSSLCGSRNVLYIYDFTEQKMISLDSPLGVNTSMIGLAIFGHYVAVNIVDCRTPFRLYVFDLRTLDKKDKDTNDWNLIVEHEFKKEEKNKIEWNLDRFFPDNESIPVESIYVHVHDTQSKRPLMVLIHGGPNSAVTLNYYIGVVAYVSLGFDMLIVNYRGSTGFGQASIDKLLGNISKTDVQDCHEAIRRCLEYTESSRPVILIGGSHAGVIIGRLIGEYPNEYAAAVLRNPVTDLLHTYATSDIPDWALAQSINGQFDFETGRNRFADTSFVTYLIERSSIRLIDQIKTPVLLQLGKKDKRVPYSIGLCYYQCLKANKIPTKLYVYDSNHGLSETSCASDCFVNTILFIHEHLNLSS
ncbi:unnamed protein product [Rotaria sp. Silwood2]|nr:unnamed protein product [Rotaria sp. Silwood2]